MTHKFKGALKYEGLSKKAKSTWVIAEGARLERLICPLCSYNQVILSSGDKAREIEDARFANIKGIALQVVYGGGRGSGFHAHEPECLTLKEMKQNQKYAGLLKKIKEQCELILEELE